MLKALAIGAGKIFQGYARPGEKGGYCHCTGLEAVQNHIELGAVVEPDTEAAERFRKNWGKVFNTTVTPSVYPLLSERSPLYFRPDIVIVTTPSQNRFELVRDILQKCKPPVLVLEKPLALSVLELDSVRDLLLRCGTHLVLCCTRHWMPGFSQVEKWIKFGKITNVNIIVAYGGGPILTHAVHTTEMLYRFGSHFGNLNGWGGSFKGKLPEDSSSILEPHLSSLMLNFGSLMGYQIGAKGPYGSNYLELYGHEATVRVGAYFPPSLISDACCLGSPPVPDLTSPYTGMYRSIVRHFQDDEHALPSNKYWEAVSRIGLNVIAHGFGNLIPPNFTVIPAC